MSDDSPTIPSKLWQGGRTTKDSDLIGNDTIRRGGGGKASAKQTKTVTE